MTYAPVLMMIGGATFGFLMFNIGPGLLSMGVITADSAVYVISQGLTGALLIGVYSGLDSSASPFPMERADFQYLFTAPVSMRQIYWSKRVSTFVNLSLALAFYPLGAIIGMGLALGLPIWRIALSSVGLVLGIDLVYSAQFLTFLVGQGLGGSATNRLKQVVKGLLLAVAVVFGLSFVQLEVLGGWGIMLQSTAVSVMQGVETLLPSRWAALAIVGLLLRAGVPLWGMLGLVAFVVTWFGMDLFIVRLLGRSHPEELMGRHEASLLVIDQLRFGATNPLSWSRGLVNTLRHKDLRMLTLRKGPRILVGILMISTTLVVILLLQGILQMSIWIVLFLLFLGIQVPIIMPVLDGSSWYNVKTAPIKEEAIVQAKFLGALPYVYFAILPAVLVLLIENLFWVYLLFLPLPACAAGLLAGVLVPPRINKFKVISSATTFVTAVMLTFVISIPFILQEIYRLSLGFIVIPLYALMLTGLLLQILVIKYRRIEEL